MTSNNPPTKRALPADSARTLMTPPRKYHINDNEEDSQEQYASMSGSDISDEATDNAPPDIINTSKKENTQRLAARTTPDKDKKITARTTRSTTKQKEEKIKANEGTAPKKKEEEAKVDGENKNTNTKKSNKNNKKHNKPTKNTNTDKDCYPSRYR